MKEKMPVGRPVQWEILHEVGDPAGCTTQRLRVAYGWLYRTMLVMWGETAPVDQPAIALCFVPDDPVKRIGKR